MFKVVAKFEEEIANFYQAPYAVAVDSCTHAIELSLRYNNVKETYCPTRTYISIPFTLKKLAIKWKFQEVPWKDYYFLGNTNIIDAAVFWEENGYIEHTFMCLSFQHKKHLSLGRGGAILTDNYTAYKTLKQLSYDGRSFDQPWTEQNISMMGYHYYMTPETAQLGLDKLDEAISTVPKIWSYTDYPYLPNMSIFRT